MNTVDAALASQLRNIEAKTGQDLDALRASITASGKSKHGEVRAWLMETYGLGYGDANGLAHFAAGSKGPSAVAASDEAVLDEIYAGKKAHLRTVHDTVLAGLRAFGEFEIAPKKGYVALRRKKQFAMLGPKSAERVELGLNLKEDVSSARIVAQKAGGMCQYAVMLTGAEDVDAEIMTVLRRAYDAAG